MTKKSTEIAPDIVRDAVAKSLGEPFLLEFSEAIRKMRTNLLIGSTIAFAACFMGLQIGSESSVFGIVLIGLTKYKILAGLLGIVLYLFLHFLWSSADYFEEWKLRRTGYKHADRVQGGFHNSSFDYSSDPRQSTLYNWWVALSRQMIPVAETLKDISVQVTEISVQTSRALDTAPDTSVLALMKAELIGIHQTLGIVNATLVTSNTVLTDQRLGASLHSFDLTFRKLLMRQNVRWLIFEFGIPMVWGLVAIVALVRELYLLS